jgi:hypothetical protein
MREPDDSPENVLPLGTTTLAARRMLDMETPEELSGLERDTILHCTI